MRHHQMSPLALFAAAALLSACRNAKSEAAARAFKKACDTIVIAKEPKAK